MSEHLADHAHTDHPHVDAAVSDIESLAKHLTGDADDAMMVKLLAAGAGVAATFVANAVIRQVWKSATGHPAPKNANDPNLKIAQAVGFAALSAAVAVLARRLATHGASRLLRATQ